MAKRSRNPFRWIHNLGVAVLGLRGAVAICELAVRSGCIKPSQQIVRGHNLRMIGDVPVWEFVTDRRENRECAERLLASRSSKKVLVAESKKS
ncbi:MAG: hypothetical protein HY897_14265 [Deltaproteobacteria bacterium]|nr:hypothetical protein [Deltaproteobacteria bacterium]